jgi:hypothetical protein
MQQREICRRRTIIKEKNGDTAYEEKSVLPGITSVQSCSFG